MKRYADAAVTAVIGFCIFEGITLQGKMQVVFKEILFLFPAFSDRITVQVKQPHVYGHPFSTRRDVLSGLTKSNSRSLNEKGQNSLVKKFIF